MADDLRVDPTDLRMSADHMDMHQADLSAAHAVANADIEAAQAGWVGASSKALQAKSAEWQEATATITRDLAAHGAAFRTAADKYASTDGDGAEHLDAQL